MFWFLLPSFYILSEKFYPHGDPRGNGLFPFSCERGRGGRRKFCPRGGEGTALIPIGIPILLLTPDWTVLPRTLKTCHCWNINIGSVLKRGKGSWCFFWGTSPLAPHTSKTEDLSAGRNCNALLWDGAGAYFSSLTQYRLGHFRHHDICLAPPPLASIPQTFGVLSATVSKGLVPFCRRKNVGFVGWHDPTFHRKEINFDTKNLTRSALVVWGACARKYL